MQRVGGRARFLQPGICRSLGHGCFPAGQLFRAVTGILSPPVSGEYSITPRAAGRNALHLFLDDKELLRRRARRRRPTRAAALRLLFALRSSPITPTASASNFPAGFTNQCRFNMDAARRTAACRGRRQSENADVAIAFVGLNPSSSEEMRVSIPGFLGGDRTDLKLPAGQERLLQARLKRGSRRRRHHRSAAPSPQTWPRSAPAAVLVSWYGGEEAGTAIAETLAGTNNPAGRLPVTFYRGVDQLPAFEDTHEGPHLSLLHRRLVVGFLVSD